MNKISRTMLSMLLAGTLLSSVFVGCAPKPAAPPEAEKVVKVGLGMALTGPLADTSEAMCYSQIDAWRYINEVKGGVDGVKVEVLWEDMEYSPPKAISLYKKFKDQGVLWMQMFGSGPCEALAATFSKDQMPNISIFNASPSIMKPKPRYVFPMLASYPDETALWLKWIKDNWKESRPPRVGVIAAEAAFGRIVLEDTPEYAEQLGMEWLGIEFVPIPTSDVTIELSRMAQKNPDSIFIQHLRTYAAVVLKDAGKLGIADKITWFIFVGAADPLFVEVAQEHAEGVYGSWMVALPHEDKPMVKIADEYTSKYRGLEASMPEYTGWVISLLAAEGLRVALKDFGYENLNGANLMKAWLSIKNFDMGGLAPRITVDPKRPIFQNKRRICVVQGGKWVPVSDWIGIPIISKY